MAQGKASPELMKSFLIKNNGDADAVMVSRLVKTYIIEANREGVNYEVAFCQMCLETGFLKFEGSVSKYQHNYCGLGCVEMFCGGDWFASMEEGVRAHIQHLKAYASFEPVRSPLVDPRFSNVRRGSVTKVTELTGKWATDPDYGQKISALITRLYGL
ncbi:MAG: glucosaminidase domain-containing protein [Bacteroidetes bacterium]|nr:glucosaminidase domain-containing protein [Bacteroidota bacterium]